MFNIFEDNEINNNIFNSPLFQNNEDVEKDSSICLSYINSLVNEEKKEEFDNSCFNEQKNENSNYIINRFQFANSNKTIHDKAKIIENNTDKIIPKKSTNISSIDNPSNITMFNAKKFLKIKRIDYSIKHFKAYFSKFLRNYGNKLIKKSELEISLKKKNYIYLIIILLQETQKSKIIMIFFLFLLEKFLVMLKKVNKKITTKIKMLNILKKF